MRVFLKRVGSMWHWRIGRVGGSVYLSKRKKPALKPALKPERRFALRLARIKGA